ncbi:MAG: glutamyl-tRNA reductase, partial [Hydrogenoanaerobacterium sp.]
TELRQTKSDELRQAECILEQYDREFTNWYYFRGLIPKVSGISSLAAKDITGRVQKTIMKLELDPDEQKKLQYQLENASAKVVSKLMFGLRDYLPPERWDECIESMEKAVQK